MEFADEDKSGVISYADFVRVLRQPSFSSLPSRASRAAQQRSPHAAARSVASVHGGSAE